MELSFDTLINTIFYVGAIQGVILTVFLFTVKSNAISNRLLGILTLSWAIILLVFALQSLGLYKRFPHLLRTFVHLTLTWFPLLFLSIKYLISRHQRFEKKDFLHFLPFVVSILLHFDFYFQSAAAKVELNESTSGYYFFVNILFQEFIGLQGIVYSIFSLRLLKKYKRNIINFQSNINNRVLKAFRVGVIISLISWSIGIVSVHLEMLNISIRIDLFIFVYLAFVLIIYLISILAIRSPEIFKLTDAELDSVTGTLNENIYGKPGVSDEKYDKNHLTDEEIQDEFLASTNQMLSELMEDEKPYLDPELSLQELAKMLDVSRHQLSAVINNYRKVNFYEFVNTYRVKEVKRLMNEKEYQMEKNISLAYDAGFNSNASFYRIFKRLTGQTPKQFRASLQH